MRKIELLPISEDVYVEVGKLTMLFSHVEWLIANVLLLCKMTPDEYAKIDKLSITQDHFEILLTLNFGRKIEALSNLSFDTTKLKLVSIFRNTLTHGIIFKGESGFTVKKASGPKSTGIDLNKDEVMKNIKILKEEGGKLLDFIEARGYKYKIDH